MLEMRNLCRYFGGLKAVNDVTAEVEPGRITALIGPNGAGKTTVFNVITGLFPATSGSIRFRGKDITGFPPHRVASMGISRTFQNIRVFPNMTVLENVMVGIHTRSTREFFSTALRLPGMRGEEKRIRSKALEALEFVGLQNYASAGAAGIPFGLQRVLEIARALASQPNLLLLDEPAAGLNTQETLLLGDLIRRILETGVTVLLVEHDMELVMKISHDIIVLDNGRLIARGTPSEIQNHPDVITAYLGRE
ncbi:MAG: ABC transporter ATP-binding protein [Candidatus Latescibacterota bacterium]